MSQRTRSQKSQSSLSQATYEKVANTEETAHNVVRYIILRGGEHMRFSQSELRRNVISKFGGKLEEVMAKVRVILKKVYGYNIMVCDATKGKEKHYIVSNALPYINDPMENPDEMPKDISKVLILLILSHILMSKNEVTDVSLYSFLKSVDIDVELQHPLFGNVKEFINKTLVKKQFLSSVVDVTSRRQTFSWGPAAEKEISKMAVLDFVCKIYKAGQPKNWGYQYQLATEQEFENDLETQAVAMDTEEE